LAGIALEFDDAGKQAGLAAAAGTLPASSTRTAPRCWTTWSRATDVTALLAVGFCIGGHLAFRAAFDPRVAATVCF
jgi:carboxymethylenebutenolidase